MFLFFFFSFPDHVFCAVSEQKEAAAVNTWLTESYSFAMVGWETEVGSVGCLNDSVPRPARALASLGHLYTSRTWLCIASARFGTGREGGGLAFGLSS